MNENATDKIPDHVEHVAAEQALEQAEQHREKVQSYLREAADFFHERSSTLMSRRTAIRSLSEALDIDRDLASNVLADIVGDRVDPVVQVPAGGKKHVGVIQYHEGEGWYGYVNYDDCDGEYKRAVCAQCVIDAQRKGLSDEHVTVADAGKAGRDYDVAFSELGDAIHEHYEDAHTTIPSEVETGATLLAGTTIGGNESWHAGNDGTGSGLDADTVDGQEAADITGYYVNDATLHEFDVSFGNSSELYSDGSEYVSTNISNDFSTIATVTINMSEFGHALFGYDYRIDGGSNTDFRVIEQSTETVYGPDINSVTNNTYTRTSFDRSTDPVGVHEFSGSTTFEIQVKPSGGAGTSTDAYITNIGVYRPQSATEIN